MKPAEGEMDVEGRVASLLEIGTGFHPELTARENIFLNGILIGMTREEVKNKYNSILDFAGLKTFENTTIKKFFQVECMLGSRSQLQYIWNLEILILDEVLAVGDIDFQAKCSRSMKEINSKN